MGSRQAQLSCHSRSRTSNNLLEILHVCTILEQVLKILLQPAFLLLKLKRTMFFVGFFLGGEGRGSFALHFFYFLLNMKVK